MAPGENEFDTPALGVWDDAPSNCATLARANGKILLNCYYLKVI